MSSPQPSSRIKEHLDRASDLLKDHMQSIATPQIETPNSPDVPPAAFGAGAKGMAM